MRLRFLNARDLAQSLRMIDTIEAMKRAFGAFSSAAATVPQRLAVAVPPGDGVLLVKPALLPGEGLGAKLVSVFPENAAKGLPVISGLVIMLDPTTGVPMGLCDGGFLTAMRTGAASGAATDLLARSDATIGAVIGCGVQGRTQAAAIDTIRSLEEIRIFDTSAEQMERFATEVAPTLRAGLVPASSPDQAIEDADIICTATPATQPVIRGALVKEGAHINGVGSFTPRMCEVESETIGRAGIFVDSREAARTEAGELICAVEQGLTRPADWVELGEVVMGSKPGRESEDEVTFFKSVGLAAQDIAAAALAFERAAELGLGTEIDLS